MADKLDLDRLEKLARAADPGIVSWHSKYQVLDGVGDDDDCDYIAAMTPAIALQLIELARRAQQGEGEAVICSENCFWKDCPPCVAARQAEPVDERAEFGLFSTWTKQFTKDHPGVVLSPREAWMGRAAIKAASPHQLDISRLTKWGAGMLAVGWQDNKELYIAVSDLERAIKAAAPAAKDGAK